MSANSSLAQRLRRWSRKNSLLRWLYWLYLMINYRTMAFYFVVMLPLVLVLMGFALLAKFSPIADPFLDVRLFAGSLGALVVIALAVVLGSRLRWAAERACIRAAIGRHLGIAPADLDREMPQRLLALVPCSTSTVRGKLSALHSPQRLWLCFLTDRLLVLSGATGDTVEVSAEELRQLHLVDATSSGHFQLALGRPESGLSVLTVQRLDDLVRVVNVLVKQGGALRHLKHA